MSTVQKYERLHIYKTGYSCLSFLKFHHSYDIKMKNVMLAVTNT